MAARGRKSNLEKVRFIFDAAAERRRALLSRDYDKLRAEPFCDIADPTLGAIAIGREAMIKLDELSEAAIASAGLDGRVGITTARNLLGPILVRMVIHERQPISGKTLHLAFEETVAAARKILTTRTHLLPCHIADSGEPDSIVVGPVTFLNRSAARAHLRKVIREHVGRKPAWERRDRQLLMQALDYYRRYRWVALVTIVDCDPQLAGDHALSTVTLALSGLQLFFGAQASQLMSVKGDVGGWARTAELKIGPDGAPDVNVTLSYRGGDSFQDGWSNDLQSSGMQLGMDLLGIALEASLPGVDRPLSSRFLGALQWYGEAVREQSPATRFIKFVTALEHLLLTGERNGITSLLARRAAAMTYEIGSSTSRLTAEREFKRIYRVRSEYVHGSAPPWDVRARHELKSAADLAESALHSALNCWRGEGLRSAQADPRHLRKWFDAVVWQMIEDTEPVDHVRCWRQLPANRIAG